jgi:hypothetical protein
LDRTERYYGDGEVELVFPEELDLIQKIPEGTFLGLDNSNEVMIVERVNPKEGRVETKGISLLKWLNNRFVRTSPNHADQYWYLEGGPPGWALWAILWNMCDPTSGFITGAAPTGIPNPQRLAIPRLALKSYDTSGENVRLGVPFGPLYDAMREIATTYQIGMSLTVESAPESGYILGFRSYKGIDRTSGQSQHPVVRFSPDMDSLTNVEELRSIENFKTHAFAFIPTSDAALQALITTPGVASRPEPQYTGFDLRAMLVFANDITTDEVGGSSTKLLDILNERAKDALTNHDFVKTVDGEIVPTNQFKYGIHYNLGDIVEVKGKSGVVQSSRVIEYIRTKNSAGERNYPTVAMLD